MNEESNYWQQLMRRRLSRRSLLRNGTIVGVSMATAGSILGCGGQTTGTTPTAGPRATAGAPTTPKAGATSASTAAPTVEQPQSGGIFKTAFTSDIPNFSLISNTTAFVLGSMGPIYNNLVMYDPFDQNKIVNDLAEKVELSPDGKVYTFTLIKGVKFHDGKPMTSADVKFTFDFVRNPPKGEVSVRSGTLAAVDGIEAPDDYTVRFILKRPSPSLLAMLSQGWMGVMPKHILEKGDMKKEAIGTGPFMLKEYKPGVSIEVVRNPNYHVKGRPYLDGVRSYIIPDGATAFAQFRTGELDTIGSLSAEDITTIEKQLADKVTAFKSPYLMWGTVNPNTKRKPWDDIRIRQAVSLALDRNEAIKILGMGYGDIGGIMPPSGAWPYPKAELEKIPGWGKDIAANRAEAKKLLAEAGFSNGFSSVMLVPKRADHEAHAVYLRDQLSKIGIDCKLDVVERAKAGELVYARSFEIASWLHGFNLDDPDSVFGEFYACNVPYNFADICDQQIEDLNAKQSQTIDVAERKKMVTQLEKLALMSFSKIPTFHYWQLLAYSRAVRNLKPHASPYTNHRKQDVWLAKK